MFKKKNIAILLNLLIVVFEIIAIFQIIDIKGSMNFSFYTDDSNLLALFTSLAFVFYSIRNKKIPDWLKLLKLTSTICLTLTFLVVLLVLAPMNNFNYGFLLFYSALLFQHFLCPIISVITFILFDDINISKWKYDLLATGFTVIYGIIIITLNGVKYLVGPYPFLEIYNQPLWQTILWIIGLFSLTYAIGLILRKSAIKLNTITNKYLK